ncbi:Lipoprotein OS=Afipia felis OX=1035 GN=BN961_01666 PE=4 SV=1 [Afipia felis]
MRWNAGVPVLWLSELKNPVSRSAVRAVLSVLVIAPIMSGCGGTLSDYSLKDQEWFQRPGAIFGTKSLSLETPPLHANKPVTPDDLITAEGACPGMAPAGLPADVAAQQGDASAAQASAPVQPTGAVALGHTECDVARAAGTPNNVNISTNERGERLAVLTYTQGPRPGVYTFTAGRLTAIDAVEAPAPVRKPKPAKRRH